MTLALLTSLIVLDFVLVFLFLRVNKRQETHGDILADLTEERRILSELQETIKDDMINAEKNSRAAVERVSHIAAEAEQEVRSGGHTLASNVEEIFNEISGKFEEPLKELAKRQAAVDALIKKAETQRLRLAKLVNRGEKIASFFDEKTPYNEVLRELETKKYEDCRSLLSRGLSNDQVASELGITKTEVEIISALA